MALTIGNRVLLASALTAVQAEQPVLGVVDDDAPLSIAWPTGTKLATYTSDTALLKQGSLDTTFVLFQEVQLIGSNSAGRGRGFVLAVYEILVAADDTLIGIFALVKLNAGGYEFIPVGDLVAVPAA